MLKRYIPSLLVVSLGVYFPFALATTMTQSAENSVVSSPTNVNPLHLRNTPIVEDKWSEWGLTKEEWTKYQEIKKSARGIWTPNLDPLIMLGVEASSDSERKRYAELLARKEFERVEKEFAFQIAYSEAFDRLYPNLLPFRNSQDNAEKRSVLETVIANKSERIIYFTKIDCEQCQDDLKRLLTRPTEKTIDIYLVDSHSNDERIRDWAIKNHIDIEKVKQRQITLNHDRGYWQQYAQGKIPAAFQVNRQGQWLDFYY